MRLQVLRDKAHNRNITAAPTIREAFKCDNIHIDLSDKDTYTSSMCKVQLLCLSGEKFQRHAITLTLIR